MKSHIRALIPARYHYVLSNVRNVFRGYKQSYYSQFGEDIVLQKIFSNKKKGTYIDVGAHHPKRYSNTYLLHKKGWSGINIDPNPHSKKLFDRARPHDKNIQCGIGNEGTLKYYQFSDPAVNTFNKEEAERWMHKNWITFLGTSEVSVHPLSNFMTDTVDLLTVDAEGMDMEVLQTNDWDTCKPGVIVVEAGSEEITPFLESKGYTLYAFLVKSLIFKKI